MIDQITKFRATAALVGLLLSGCNFYALAQQGDVLNPAQHPKSPEATRIYSSNIVPLDASLSWTKRFDGNEQFSSEQLNVTNATMAKTEEAASENQAMPNMSMDAAGVIKSVKLKQGKVKISHGPIEKYGMPSMTMMFKVKDAAMLENINKGEEISFNVDNTSGGFVVTELTPIAKSADTGTQSGMDASGEVKLVRASQGKVKISHGPIEKFGMPSMTMMFKVKDPSLLNQLEKGTEVDFDVDNSAGGFVITNIKPTAN